MKTFLPTLRRGFTLIELIVVVATVTVLFGLMLPAMGKARIRSTDVGCLNNLRQMMVGWAMYKDDNKDILLPNGNLGGTSSETWCSGAGQNWFNAPANINPTLYLNSLLAPYIANRIELYHCPADIIPSDNGLRIRSYSMNGNMGAAYYSGSLLDGSYNPGWRVYAKGSDLTKPTPQNAFIFADENMASLNDGYLQIRLTFPQYPDIPAAYHDGAGSFSFADGHVELRHWFGSVLPSVPYKHGLTQSSVATGSSDPDWRWLTNHASSKR
jgi:prepilin-type N-terminal cleavage/methylation domain-containing protein/prepilin-type processing-associated H-X9-DG protein